MNYKQKVALLKMVLEKVVDDYKGLQTTCKKYELLNTFEDAGETVDFIEQILKVVEQNKWAT